jgi:hypothetical protein
MCHSLKTKKGLNVLLYVQALFDHPAPMERGTLKLVCGAARLWTYLYQKEECDVKLIFATTLVSHKIISRINQNLL